MTDGPPARPRRRLPVPRTVRGRLTLLGAGVMAVALAVTALALVNIQNGQLVKAIDEGLRQRVENLQADVAAQGPATELLGSDDTEDTFLQLLDASGQVLTSSRNLAGEPAVTGPASGPGAETVTTASVPTISASDFRVLVHGIGGRAGRFTLVVGKNLDDVHDSVRVLTTALLLLLPCVVAVLAAMVWWVTGRTLRSVEEIRAEVDRIGGDDLGRRVPRPDGDDEIARLASTMNAMLARLERATQRQRQFTSDASHELRGPLTRLRSELELAVTEAGRNPTSPDRTGPDRTAAQRYRRLLEDAVELQDLVEDLLFLARADDGPRPAPGCVVDIDDLVLDEAKRLRAESRVRVDTTGVGPARTLGEPGHLARALRNLTANAARHARSTVYLESREVDGHCRLVVADDGPGIPAEHRDAVFERFVRLDESRSRDDGGSGLGLAIVKEIVTRHAGTVVVDDGPAGGARFTVTLPAG